MESAEAEVGRGSRSNSSQTVGLFLLLGFPSWALVDGTWAALSQLAQRLPEGYKISSYLMLALTLGNTVTILAGTCLLRKATFRKLHIVVALVITVGFLAGIGLSIFWNVTVNIRGSEISLPLYICFFLVGCCATMSNVTHMTFVSHWTAANTTWLATGMGLGSMCAGLLSLLQGLLQSQGMSGFSVQTYYLILTSLFVPAFAALQFLNKPPEKKRIVNVNGDDGEHHFGDELGSDNDDEVLGNEDDDCTILLSSTVDSVPIAASHDSYENNGKVLVDRDDLEGKYIFTDRQFIQRYYPYLLFQMINASMGFGLIPSIISYVCGKFVHGSLYLLLATSISAVVDPAFRALTIRFRIQSMRWFLISVSLLSLLSFTLFAFLWVPSTNSALFDGHAGIVVVFIYPIVNAVNVFTNTSIFLFFKGKMDEKHMQQCYRIGGVATQCGSVVGTLLAFLLILLEAV
jgi:hypothetical protein